MNHLLRSIAPIPESGWELLDTEARERLTGALAARKLVDFSGPLGWEHSATDLGRTEAVAEAALGGRYGAAAACTSAGRAAQRLPRLAATSSATPSAALQDVDLAALDEAARRIACAENVAVFHGLEQAGITGITEASTQSSIALSDDFDAYPVHVAKAVELLRRQGIGGPYGLALGPTATRA